MRRFSTLWRGGHSKALMTRILCPESMDSALEAIRQSDSLKKIILDSGGGLKNKPKIQPKDVLGSNSKRRLLMHNNNNSNEWMMMLGGLNLQQQPQQQQSRGFKSKRYNNEGATPFQRSNQKKAANLTSFNNEQKINQILTSNQNNLSDLLRSTVGDLSGEEKSKLSAAIHGYSIGVNKGKHKIGAF